MANRDLSTPRTVIQQAVEQPNQLVGGLAAIGTEIITNSQRAKINEGLSQAQLDIERMNNDYRTASQGDPFNDELRAEYQQLRKDRLDELGSEISPFFRDEWNQSAARLENQSDVANQAWSFKQARVNTIQSINTTIKNNMALASEAGRDFATNATTDVEALLQFAPAKQAITRSAAGILGETELNAFLDTYEEDYLKSFISGVAEDNPVKALQLLNDPKVKQSISDSEGYSKFKTAIENRAVEHNQVQVEREVLRGIASSDVLLKQSLSGPLSYAELQTAAKEMGLSEAGEAYLMKKSGFTKESVKLDPVQKAQLKNKITNQVVQMTKEEDLAGPEIKNLQDKIFDAMTKGAINETEGAGLMAELITPSVEGRGEHVSAYSSGDWNPFKSNVGFLGVKDYYEEKVAIDVDDEDTSASGKRLRATNAVNEANLYDFYYEALRVEAAQNNTTVVGLDDLPNRREIFIRAQDRAVQNFKLQQAPFSLKTEIPVNAIRLLLQHPDKASDFDRKYGVGSANRILGNE